MDTFLVVSLHRPVTCRLDMLRDIASGMVFLHSRKPPIVHGDLRSPNLVSPAHGKHKHHPRSHLVVRAPSLV
jgi:hypothetical protein